MHDMNLLQAKARLLRCKLASFGAAPEEGPAPALGLPLPPLAPVPVPDPKLSARLAVRQSLMSFLGSRVRNLYNRITRKAPTEPV